MFFILLDFCRWFEFLHDKDNHDFFFFFSFISYSLFLWQSIFFSHCFTFIHILPSFNVFFFPSLLYFVLVILFTFITSHSSLVFFLCLLVCLLPYFFFSLVISPSSYCLIPCPHFVFSSHDSNTLPYYIFFVVEFYLYFHYFKFPTIIVV